MFEALGQAALRTLLLACVVQLALWLFRIREAQLRLIGWTVILAASLAMPVLQQVTPLRTAVVLDIPIASLLGIGHPQMPAFDRQAVPSALSDSAEPLRATWPLLEVVYFLIGGTLLLRLAIGIALSWRLLSRASPIGAEWAAATRVRISPDVTAPVTVFNVILLPADIAHWPSAMRQAVLAHEKAHVARWDYAMLLASQLNRVVFWFSPFSWWLHRRLTRLAELASDDHALQVTGDRPGYAEILLEMGRRSGPLLRELAMARPAMLLYRIERVLREGGKPKSVGWARCSVVLIGAAGLTFAAASVEPSSGPVASPDARAQGREAPALQEGSPSLFAQAADDTPGTAPNAERKAQYVSQAPSQSASMPQSALPPMPQPRPATRVAARATTRPLRRLVVRDTLPVPPLRQVSWTTRDTREIDEAHDASGKSDAEHDPPPVVAHQGGHQAANEPHLLKLVDQQTCKGVYLPGASGVFPGDWLNLVSAKFIRNSDGTPSLTFQVGGRTPVNLPVKMTGGGVEFIGLQATTFKVLPRGANHLTGTTQRPYGTIDLACGGSNSHLFDDAD